MTYDPPFTFNEAISTLTINIGEAVGRLSQGHALPVTLRRENRIRSIHSSLAIENNTLTMEQVSDIIAGKRVWGPPQDVREARNAYAAYEKLLELNPFSVDDLLIAHGIMMAGLVPDAGRFRSGNVGVYSGDQLIHAGTPPRLVPELIEELLSWAKRGHLHPLLVSCIVHYELEFIHPFSDGNGRTGRLWHTLLLTRWNPVFQWVPVESVIRERQSEYYAAIHSSNTAADSQAFVQFMLEVILTALTGPTDQVTDQAGHVERLLRALGTDTLSATELMARLKLSHRPSFRQNYLNPALESGVIERTIPDRPSSPKQRYRRS